MDRYACEQVAAHWSLGVTLARWTRVWSAANAATGHPFSPGGDVWIDPARMVALEARYGHDVAAACETLRECLRDRHEPDAARWLHYGLCSSDVADAALWIAIREVTAELVDLTDIAITGVVTGAASWPDEVVHRTHGQAAQVGNGVVRWGRAAHNLAAAKHSLTNAQKRMSLPAFNGPTGTGGVLSIAQRTSIRTKLAGSHQGAGASGSAGQNVGRDELVQWCQAVSRLATACERFGRDVRLLAASGVDEVTEGRGLSYRGSSSMPHKRNPTRSERLCGLAPVVRGLVNGYQEAAAECWDAHSLEHSSAERVVIPQATELTGFMLQEVYAIATTWKVNGAECAENVDVAPADSYKRRNELIREGVDGGDAWELASDNR